MHSESALAFKPHPHSAGQASALPEALLAPPQAPRAGGAFFSFLL